MVNTHYKKKARVYFFNPSYQEHNIDFFNMGIINIASYLKQKGISADVYLNYLDDQFTKDLDYDRILPTILSKPHRYVGITCMTVQIKAALNLSRRIKAISPDTQVVLGGPHANIYAEHLLEENNFIDFCVRGPGERAAELLYRYLDKGGIDISDIPGLTYRENGMIKKNESAPLEKEIYDQQIDYSVVASFKPVERFLAGESVKQAAIFNTLGCPYSCRFCINSVGPKKIIFRDLKFVIAEIQQVLEKGANSIFFIDELLFIKGQRLDEFLDRISEKKLCFSWFAHSRIDLVNVRQLNEDRLRRIRECGCRELHFGIESGSPRMLDYINKKFDVKQVIPVLKKVIDAGILPKVNFIFGMPGETIEDVKRTIYLIMEIANSFEEHVIIMNFFFYPIPGSPMTEESFMGIDIPDKVKIKYCIDAARYSVRPYKLFKFFDKEGFYGWIPDKKLFAEIWFIARVISDICSPYKYRKGYNPQIQKWSLRVSQETYDELVNSCLQDIDRSMVVRWLDKVRAIIMPTHYEKIETTCK